MPNPESGLRMTETKMMISIRKEWELTTPLVCVLKVLHLEYHYVKSTKIGGAVGIESEPTINDRLISLES